MGILGNGGNGGGLDGTTGGAACWATGISICTCCDTDATESGVGGGGNAGGLFMGSNESSNKEKIGLLEALADWSCGKAGSCGGNGGARVLVLLESTKVPKSSSKPNELGVSSILIRGCGSSNTLVAVKLFKLARLFAEETGGGGGRLGGIIGAT